MELFPLIRAGKGAKVRALLEDDKGDHKRDVNVRNEKGQTPLYWACELKSDSGVELAALLIKHGADVNLPEDHGFTPLHLAAYIGNVSVVRLLLESGALVNKGNKSQSTALHLASRNGHEAAVALLIQHGADIPLAYAKDAQISKLLQDAMLVEGRQSRARSVASAISREELATSSQSDDEARKKARKRELKKKDALLRRPSKRELKMKDHDDEETKEYEEELEKLKSLVGILSDRLAREERITESLQRERDEARRRGLCERCRQARRDTVLVPCMHLAFCWDCCGRMAMKCHKCGVGVEGMMRVNVD
ncbi:chain a, 4ank: a designed ankyrin repeat protein [Acanthamoeba castellanii str. Neff]|uniref:Chain a, 4ank: a designed ankyrin repeat protein n=1 Tax=Acanthamoeba castellanii (strain ATCC 30010 / Neff) TaxID=1257118 RepID=L8GYU2_ACACF|nr:chain a, 4ank: a designed ankyrin repeat protein [Acanthamoeba castellanii str. Neff]ELR18454.1 chain a, 4ank: a designed ankyrin repeat protein [Acanthamoeba castellanii str. Neff]